MSFLVDTSRRSSKTELMDDFSLKGSVIRDTLDKLETLNRLLGGNATILKALETLLKKQSKIKPIIIVDLGCGHGDILRDVAKFGRKNNYTFKLIGIDANAAAVDYARELSKGYPELTFKVLDVFSEDFKKQSYDVMMSNLFLHHFKDSQLRLLLKQGIQKATIGAIINDLHRHRLAYYLFKFAALFIRNKMVVNDGLISILKAFKRNELETISSQIHAQFTIQWKWAFRYLCILKKTPIA